MPQHPPPHRRRYALPESEHKLITRTLTQRYVARVRRVRRLLYVLLRSTHAHQYQHTYTQSTVVPLFPLQDEWKIVQIFTPAEKRTSNTEFDSFSVKLHGLHCKRCTLSRNDAFYMLQIVDFCKCFLFIRADAQTHDDDDEERRKHSTARGLTTVWESNSSCTKLNEARDFIRMAKRRLQERGNLMNDVRMLSRNGMMKMGWMV